MISKERLEELIEQEAVVYTNNSGYDTLNLKQGKFHIARELLMFDYKDFCIPIKDIYETKEDAEFVLKYYTTKTYRFEPPTWEEFLATRDENSFAHWFCGDICVVMVEENDKKGILKTHNQFEVDIYCEGDSKLKRFDYFNNYGIDTRKETYYEALEYARELFLGGSDGDIR